MYSFRKRKNGSSNHGITYNYSNHRLTIIITFITLLLRLMIKVEAASSLMRNMLPSRAPHSNASACYKSDWVLATEL